MGCDIHLFVEKRIDGIWQAQQGINKFELDFYQGLKNKEPYHYKIIERAKVPCYENWIYDGRNYDLFGILAGVRSGIEPITPTKGIPSDASEIVLSEREFWEYDGFSSSYYTLNELLSYNWSQGWEFDGLVKLTDYEEYLSTCDTWLVQHSAFAEAVFITTEEADKIINGEITLTKVDNVFVQVKAFESHFDLARTFCMNTIESMIELSEDVDFNDVRIVFWFDN